MLHELEVVVKIEHGWNSCKKQTVSEYGLFVYFLNLTCYTFQMDIEKRTAELWSALLADEEELDVKKMKLEI